MGEKLKMESYKYAYLKPINFMNIKITGGILYGYIDKSKSIGIFDCYNKFEEAGSIDNYRIIAQGIKKNHRGFSNNNEFVYKWMEACGYYAKDEKSKKIIELLDVVIDLVCKTQGKDGYINTYYDNPKKIETLNLKHFDTENRFEFYSFGHLMLAAIAYYKSTGKDEFLNAGIKFADLIIDLFKKPNKLPYRMNKGPIHLKREHPNHEIAFVELYRLTGDKKYIKFTEQTLSEYGYWQQNANKGHAVQEVLLNCSAVDLYLEKGDIKKLDICEQLYDDMCLKKMYITGAVGSRHKSEAFGENYELPNDRAYAETCASISNFFWSYNLLLATGKAKYADYMERILYNAILSGISLDGKNYAYQNPLSYIPIEAEVPSKDANILEIENPPRKEWFSCPCCPPNIHRLFASIQKYIYTYNNKGIQVHLYISSQLDCQVIYKEKIILHQKTNYPFEGKVEFKVELENNCEFEISLRIPKWCRKFDILINNEQYISCKNEHNDYFTINRLWRNGDNIILNMDLPIRLEMAHPYTSNTGKVAIIYGPLVYCLEQNDNTVDIFDIILPINAKFKIEREENVLNGAISISTQAYKMDMKIWKDKLYREYMSNNKLEKVDIKAIPYFLWGNRKPGKMLVWIPYREL